jgi:competence protein ComEA
MAAGKFDRFWTLVTILLVVIIVIGGIVAWLRYSPGEPIEISISQGQDWQGNIYIGGAVNNPGIYPFEAGDSLGELIQAAGGTVDNNGLDGLELYVPEEEEEQEVQKININRAEVWLLEALPGIGETLAQRIVDYRQQNGPFHSIDELLKVEGIGDSRYEQIKNFITVAD